MKARSPEQAKRLEDQLNIGKSIAADLRTQDIAVLGDLLQNDPLAQYLQLGALMWLCHNPLVLYTLMAARHFMQTGKAVA